MTCITGSKWLIFSWNFFQCILLYWKELPSVTVISAKGHWKRHDRGRYKVSQFFSQLLVDRKSKKNDINWPINAKKRRLKIYSYRIMIDYWSIWHRIDHYSGSIWFARFSPHNTSGIRHICFFLPLLHFYVLNCCLIHIKPTYSRNISFLINISRISFLLRWR